MSRSVAAFAAASLALSSMAAACSDDASTPPTSAVDGGASSSSSSSSSSGGSSSGGADGGARPTCHAAPIADDAPRTIVISHPFGAGGAKDNRYERLELGPNGAITRPDVVFSMGRNFAGDIVFTPDGKLGLSAQEDGTIGVFRVESDGKVTVVDRGFKGKGYVERILMAPDGASVLVLDMNTKENGGGLYEVMIGCDGKLEDRGLVVAGGSPTAAAWLGAGKALVSARAIGASPDTDELHVVDVASGARLGGGPAFGDKEAINASVAVSGDGKIALVADNGILVGSRVAVVSVAGSAVAKKSLLAVKNPVSVAFSPFGNAGVVVGSDGEDDYFRVKVDTAATTPVVLDAAPIAYKNGKPQLPGAAHVIERGPLKGRVVIAEVSGIRQLTFTAAGALEDTSAFEVSKGNDIPGSVGTLGIVR